MKIKKETAIKILAAMLTLLTLISCMQSTVFAETDYLNPDNMKAKESTLATTTQDVAAKVLGIVQIVAIAVAVIMLIVLAMKYLTSSPYEKADVKKSMFTYLIGAIVLFGASGILQIIKNFAVANIKDGTPGTTTKQ